MSMPESSNPQHQQQQQEQAKPNSRIRRHNLSWKRAAIVTATAGILLFLLHNNQRLLRRYYHDDATNNIVLDQSPAEAAVVCQEDGGDQDNPPFHPTLQLLRENVTSDACIAPLATAVAKTEGKPWSLMEFRPGPSSFCRTDPPERCNCGIYKCFFEKRSTRNHTSNNHNQTTGFLVARRIRRIYEDMTSAYDLEQRLIRDFGVTTQLALGPPKKHRPSDGMVQVLRRYGCRRCKNGSKSIVQPVLKIPEPNLYVHAGSAKSDKIRPALPGFVAALNQLHTFDKAQFAHRLQKEIQICLHVLEQIPSLRRDFQVMVGRHGELYYIDLDRAFERYTNPLMSVARIRHGLERLQYWLTTSIDESSSSNYYDAMMKEDSWWSKEAVGEASSD